MVRVQRVWSRCALGAWCLFGCQRAPEAPALDPEVAAPRASAHEVQGAASARPAPPSSVSSNSGTAAESSSSADSVVPPASPDSADDAGMLVDHAGAATAKRNTGVDTRVSSSEWISYGHDMSNTRHNPAEKMIGVENVATLTERWRWTTAAVTSTPAYRDGELYFGDWQGAVVALDAATGRERWRTLDSQNVVGQITTSAFVDADAVYIGGILATWYRLNRATGAIEWRTQANQGGSSNSLSSLQRIGELAIAGTASFQNINPVDTVLEAAPFRGSIVAVNATTGAKSWELVLTTGTGVGVCSSPAFDTERGLMFIGTGQNYDNTDSPYADSLIALDYQTGEYAWHVQYTKGDAWWLGNMDDGDLDILSSPVLYTANGVDMVAVGDKGGMLRAFDRDGKPQWMRQLTPGGHHGGIMGSAAYHDGSIYICSGDFTTDQGDGTGTSGPASSTLFALDAGTGAIRWSAPISGLCYGSLTHANGVVYLPGGSGRLQAFADSDGRELWAVDLGSSSAGGVTVVHGMLYVSYGWDWTNLAPTGGVRAFGLP